MTDRLQQLSEAGVSIWLDDLSRERLETGNLADLVADSNVVGVTTNPSIFQAALSHGERYDAQIRELAARVPTPTRRSASSPPTTSVKAARCCVPSSTPPTESTGGSRSRSPPVWPTTPTAPSPRPPSSGRPSSEPNLLIKIPGTQEGCPAITETLAAGISVNVTLIFGLDQYPEVMEAYVAGLEKARENGHDLSTIHSVASFFVSRVDTEIDKRLDATTSGPGTEPCLKGKAGVANARLAFKAFEEFFAGDRWASLEADGARLAAPAVGVDRGEEPRLRRHDVRRRPGRRGHRQHDARGDHRRGRGPRRGPRRPGPAVLRRCRRPHACARRRPASTTTT